MAIRYRRRASHARHGDAVADAATAQTTTRTIQDIRRGYPWSFARQLQGKLGLNDRDFAALLGVSGRTLGRMRSSEETLDAVASDRLYRLVRVVELAGAVLDDEAAGLRWLGQPQFGLGEKAPLSLLDTEPGFAAVVTLLQQIEYGVLP